MSDLQKKIMEIIAQPQLSGLATVVDGNKPWVRYVVTMADRDLNIRCASFVESRKTEQIAANSEVHLTCGSNSFTEMKPYLQIQGRARVTTDKDERHGFWNEMLTPIFEGPDDPKYCVIIIEPYRIEYCSPGSFVPEVWEK